MATTRQGGEFPQTPAADDVLNLGLGQPSPSLLPLHALAEAARERLGPGNDPLVLQYGAIQGHEGFRAALAGLLTAETGLAVRPEELAVTGGISLGLGMVAQTLARPGDRVACGDPTYFLARGILESQHLRPVGIPVDAGGIDVDALARTLDGGTRIALLYVIPSFHNPCGVTLAPDRADALVDLAERHDFVIVADEPYVMLHWGEPPPSMMSYDRGRGRVVSLGSFSKILGPGLRLGWVHAGAPLLERFLEHGVLRSGGCLNPMVASIVQGTIDSGFLQGHVAGLRQTFARRARTLCEALDTEFPTMEFTRPSGGYFVWGRLPDVDDTSALLERAREAHGVAFTPGSRCAIERDLSNYVRLSFAFYEGADLTDAVGRLRAAVDARSVG